MLVWGHRGANRGVRGIVQRARPAIGRQLIDWTRRRRGEAGGWSDGRRACASVACEGTGAGEYNEQAGNVCCVLCEKGEGREGIRQITQACMHGVPDTCMRGVPFECVLSHGHVVVDDLVAEDNVFIGEECLLVCGILVGGDGMRVSVMLVGCLVAAGHGWFVVAFDCAMLCVIAWPPLLSPFSM